MLTLLLRMLVAGRLLPACVVAAIIATFACGDAWIVKFVLFIEA